MADPRTGEYHRKSASREDPRLSSRKARSPSSVDKKSYNFKLSPETASESPTKNNNWQNIYGQAQPMQTAYQHLPATMYSDPNQYSAQNYQNTYSAYQQNYNSAAGSYNHYQGYGQPPTSYIPTPGLPSSEEYPQTGWAPVAGNYVNSHGSLQPVQPPAAPVAPPPAPSDEKKDAIAQELKQQKAQLTKQREEYVRKAKVLRRELELLRTQKQELLAESSPQRDTQHILRENSNLQEEIQSKMKAIYNVIEMLSSIIRDGLTTTQLEDQLRDDSPSKTHRKSLTTERYDISTKYNYIHYDPEVHWCRTCDHFPKTAKEFLLHLQSEEHRKIAQERDMKDDTPWHHLPGEPELPYYEGAPKKRLPIKGLQFFIPASAWYCKLCDSWIGDLHCASQHLKSQVHSQNYANFVEQNPHWEIEWLKDREKAFARSAKHSPKESDDADKKRKRSRKDKYGDSVFKEKKKKKRSKKRRRRVSESDSSSSSSSDSSSDDDDEEKEKGDKSKSIRVAMRNVKVDAIMKEDLGSKWEMLGRLVEEHKQKEAMAVVGEKKDEVQPQPPPAPPPEDRLINQWMTVSGPPEKDKYLLDSLKDRMKQKQEVEKARLADAERKQREKDKQEAELKQKKEKEEKEARDKEESMKREKERQEFERIRDRDREQVRFKTKDKHTTTKKRSPTPNRDARKPPEPSTQPEKQRQARHSPDRRENGRSSRDHRNKSAYDSSPKPKRRFDDKDSSGKEKKPPPPPSYKKLPFIGRMPLFKNKKPDDKSEKEIKKEDYDIPRQTRFQPGNLARAFLPEPDVVCFPKLSSIPPITIPAVAPAAPIISESRPPKAPPAPRIGENTREEKEAAKEAKEREDEQKHEQEQKEYQMYTEQMQMDPSVMAQYQYDYNMMYQQHMYDFSQDIPLDEVPEEISGVKVPLAHTMPLQPPPLPPDDPNDDLAMLGISADDMAAQIF